MAADKKYHSDGPSAADKALERFTELMIEKIQSFQGDWKKPWFMPGTTLPPQNLSGRHYNGGNSLMLMLQAEKMGYDIPVWGTFDRITNLNMIKDKHGNVFYARDENGFKLPQVTVNKGEKSFPVFLTTFTVVDPKTKEKIPYDDYRNLSKEEQAKYKVYPKLQVFNVFNVAGQTNIAESRPELYEKLKSLAAGQIEHQGDLKSTNTLHECAHATGAKSRLDRIQPGQTFGSPEYAKEELTAELSAALIASQHGLTKHVKSDSAAYLKSWLSSLQQGPDFLKTVLSDVKHCTSMINQRLDAIRIELEKGEKADFSLFRLCSKPALTSGEVVQIQAAKDIEEDRQGFHR